MRSLGVYVLQFLPKNGSSCSLNAIGENMNITIDRIKDDEVESVCDLIREVFKASVAPLYSKKGVDNFLNGFTAEEYRKNNNLVLVAHYKNEIVGVLEIKNLDHISRFFVDLNYQRRGIGKQLFKFFLDNYANSGSKQISVNSSPNSVDAYRSLGFSQLGEEQESKDGIKYVSMQYSG